MPLSAPPGNTHGRQCESKTCRKPGTTADTSVESEAGSVWNDNSYWVRHVNEAGQWKRVLSDDKELEVGEESRVELVFVVLVAIRISD